MPGVGYPKDRVASTKYEKGGVKSGVPAKSTSGSEGFKPKRAGSGK